MCIALHLPNLSQERGAFALRQTNAPLHVTTEKTDAAMQTVNAQPHAAPAAAAVAPAPASAPGTRVILPSETQRGALLGIDKTGTSIEWEPSDDVLDVHGESAMLVLHARHRQTRVHQGFKGEWRAKPGDVPASPGQAVEFKFNQAVPVPAAGQAFTLPEGTRAMRVSGPDGAPILIRSKGLLRYWRGTAGRISAFGRDGANLDLWVGATSLLGEHGRPFEEGQCPRVTQAVEFTARINPKNQKPEAQRVTGVGGAAVARAAAPAEQNGASPMEQ